MLYLNTIKTITSDYSNKPEDRCLNVDTTSGNVTITLRTNFPLQTIPNAGQFYSIQIRKTAVANTVTIQGTDFTINGSSSYSLTALYESITLVLDPKNKNWMVSAQAGSSSSGTVTSFSAGNLTPLFTTSVATATTTPALSFILSNTSGNTWFGNNTSGSTTPTYNLAGVFSRINDTNVTAELYGAPSGSVLNDFGIQLGWSGTLATSRGGTNISSYAVGDILYASNTTTLSKLPIGTSLQQLRTNAGATAPEWFTPLAQPLSFIMSGSFNPTDATSYFINSAPLTPVTSVATRQFQLPYACTLVGASISVNVSGTNPTAENTAFYLRVNNTTDYTITTTFPLSTVNNYNYAAISGLSVPLAANDLISVKWTTPTWATNPTQVNLQVTIWLI